MSDFVTPCCFAQLGFFPLKLNLGGGGLFLEYFSVLYQSRTNKEISAGADGADMRIVAGTAGTPEQPP